MLEAIKSIPEPERSFNLVLKTINNIYSLLSTIKGSKDESAENSEIVSPTLHSEYSAISLQILERLSGTVSGNAATWIAKGAKDSKPRRTICKY
ncbi:hypothetical protein BC829DRAFT_269654 [Chytridium lagenaria]|nr:hypothetical protein BC829DRAFT_269654 [Chytridium lagenaria]